MVTTVRLQSPCHAPVGVLSPASCMREENSAVTQAVKATLSPNSSRNSFWKMPDTKAMPDASSRFMKEPKNTHHAQPPSTSGFPASAIVRHPAHRHTCHCHCTHRRTCHGHHTQTHVSWSPHTDTRVMVTTHRHTRHGHHPQTRVMVITHRHTRHGHHPQTRVMVITYRHVSWSSHTDMCHGHHPQTRVMVITYRHTRLDHHTYRHVS